MNRFGTNPVPYITATTMTKAKAAGRDNPCKESCLGCSLGPAAVAEHLIEKENHEHNTNAS